MKASDNGKSPPVSDLPVWMSLRDEIVWRLRQDDPFGPAISAMLAEVATALRLAARLREEAEEELFTRSDRTGRAFAHPGVALADQEVRRAALLLSRVAALADLRPEDDEPEEAPNPFAELDELTSRGSRRAGGENQRRGAR